MILIGADTHKHTHTLTAIGAATGQLLDDKTIPASKNGFIEGAPRNGRPSDEIPARLTRPTKLIHHGLPDRHGQACALSRWFGACSVRYA